MCHFANYLVLVVYRVVESSKVVSNGLVSPCRPNNPSADHTHLITYWLADSATPTQNASQICNDCRGSPHKQPNIYRTVSSSPLFVRESCSARLTNPSADCFQYHVCGRKGFVMLGRFLSASGMQKVTRMVLLSRYGGCIPRSKRDNSQCSIAPDCRYKRWSTNREPPRAYERHVYIWRIDCTWITLQ